MMAGITVAALEKILGHGVAAGVFPGAAAGVVNYVDGGYTTVTATVGNGALEPEPRPLTATTLFDLASLTKPLATGLALGLLLEEGRVGLTDTLVELLARPVDGWQANTTLAALLTHSSGLPAWRPYYQQLQHLPPGERKQQLWQKILRESPAYEPGSRSLYSDLGYILLGWIVEQKTGMALDRYVEQRIYAPAGVSDIFFRRLSRRGTTATGREYAATEYCPWRKKILCGEVHDDHAWLLDGVAGHAGLFGTIDGLVALCCRILDGWQNRGGKGVLTPSVIKRLCEYRQENSIRALGFDRPAAVDSSCGRFFDANTVGHLGFTGTSFWIDPRADRIVILLTNRVHPSRENNRIRDFRPWFHDQVIQSVTSGCCKETEGEKDRPTSTNGNKIRRNPSPGEATRSMA